MASKIRLHHAHADRTVAGDKTAKDSSRRATKAPLPVVSPRPHPATMVTATYETDECEYMAAVQQFKARTGRTFPTVSDMLAIAKSLGYSRSASNVTHYPNHEEGR